MYKYIAILGLIIVIAGAGFHYKSVLAENKRLKLEIETANKEIAKLDKKILAERKVAKDVESLKKEIRNANPEDDGPIAPVLIDAITRIDGLRESKSE